MRRPALPLLAAALVAGVLGLPGVSDAGQAGPARLELQASRRGFQPKRLSLRRGEAVEIVLTAAEGEHCFAVDALRVEKRVVAGRVTRFSLTPARAGVFPFHCCLESGAAAERERGELTVSD